MLPELVPIRFDPTHDVFLLKTVLALEPHKKVGLQRRGAWQMVYEAFQQQMEHQGRHSTLRQCQDRLKYLTSKKRFLEVDPNDPRTEERRELLLKLIGQRGVRKHKSRTPSADLDPELSRDYPVSRMEVAAAVAAAGEWGGDEHSRQDGLVELELRDERLRPAAPSVSHLASQLEQARTEAIAQAVRAELAEWRKELVQEMREMHYAMKEEILQAIREGGPNYS